MERIAGPHCYSFFAGNDTFADWGDDTMRAFFLTDFLARQFDAFITRPLGLDRHPQLATLGPEPLGNTFNAGVLAEAFRGRNSPVKAALLDQKTVAGLGSAGGSAGIVQR